MSKKNGKGPHRKGATGKSKAEAARENGALSGGQGGRPEIHINWDEFDKLCEFGSTLEEIASWFQTSPDTIERRVQDEKGWGFAEYFAQKHTKVLTSLRRRQIQRALGDPARGIQPSDKLLIHLGKHKLGQSDTLDLKVAGALTVGPGGDPYQDFIELLIELVTNPDTRNELSNLLKQHGIQFLTDGTTGQVHKG